MELLLDKIKNLTNEELIQLSNELQETTLPENALVREVIKNTEVDTSIPMIAFVGVGQNLAFVLADRLQAYISNSMRDQN